MLVTTDIFAASARALTPRTSATRQPRVPGSVPLPQSRGIYSQSAKSWPCKIDPFKLQAYLDGFDRYEKQYVIDGIRFGFNIQSSVPPRAESVYTNHKSALDASHQVTAKLLQDLELQVLLMFAPQVYYCLLACSDVCMRY